MFVFFFFFKQKTAYEMRISDWSSDVCSSDLRLAQSQKEDKRSDKGRGQDQKDCENPPQHHAAFWCCVAISSPSRCRVASDRSRMPASPPEFMTAMRCAYFCRSSRSSENQTTAAPRRAWANRAV